MSLHKRFSNKNQEPYRAFHDFYHVVHTCGHAVYWTDPTRSYLYSRHPCPRCGGASGVAAPPTANVLTTGPFIVGFLDLVNGDAPISWPIIMRHRADGDCCRPSPLTRKCEG